MPPIDIIIANVDAEQLTLPSFQRGYVWGRQQVRNLFDSLYRGHPVGSLLTWLTTRDGFKTELLLDGQQRVTSLYGVIKGHPPKFFIGNDWAFKGLFFHAVEKKFEFHQPIKMKGDPLWFDVTKVMKAGADEIASLIREQFAEYSEFQNLELQIKVTNSLIKLVGLAKKDGSVGFCMK
ncbi:MAG: DUF262 domain-containing protein [Bacteroidetes bacterium]|nr:DUF262 domain-containing protein [Bacteroidota bacterium]